MARVRLAGALVGVMLLVAGCGSATHWGASAPVHHAKHAHSHSRATPLHFHHLTPQQRALFRLHRHRSSGCVGTAQTRQLVLRTCATSHNRFHLDH